MIIAWVTTAGIVVSAIAGSVAAKRSRVPRGKLRYQLAHSARLLARRADFRQVLAVADDGRRVSDPYLAVIRLSNSRSCDIPAKAFAQAIEIDAGAEIVRVLAVAVEPPYSTVPEIRHSSRSILIGPSLISSGQQIMVSLITDGRPALLGRASIENAVIRPQRPRSRPAQYTGAQAAAIGAMTLAAAAISIGASAVAAFVDARAAYIPDPAAVSLHVSLFTTILEVAFFSLCGAACLVAESRWRKKSLAIRHHLAAHELIAIASQPKHTMAALAENHELLPVQLVRLWSSGRGWAGEGNSILSQTGMDILKGPSPRELG